MKYLCDHKGHEKREVLFRFFTGGVLLVVYLSMFLVLGFERADLHSSAGPWIIGLEATVVAVGIIVITILISNGRVKLPFSLLVLMFLTLFVGELIQGNFSKGYIVAISTVAIVSYAASTLNKKLGTLLLFFPIGTIGLSFVFWKFLEMNYFRYEWTSTYLGEFPFFMGISGHPNQFGYLMVFGLLVLWSFGFSKIAVAFWSIVFGGGILASGSDGAIVIAVTLAVVMVIESDLRSGRSVYRSWKSVSALSGLVAFASWSVWLVGQGTLATVTSGRTSNWSRWYDQVSAETLDPSPVDPHVSWLHLISAGGFPAVLLAVCFFVLALHRIFHSGKAVESRLALGATWILISVSGIETFWASGGLTMPTVLVGLLASALGSIRSQQVSATHN